MKNRKIINTNNAPQAIGAYSQAIIYNDLLFTSGQIPLDPNTGEIISDDIEKQIYQVLYNIKGILLSEGLTFNNIIKLTVYLVDLKDFDKVNFIFNEIFKKNFPARSVVEVSKLPKDSKVEIEAVCHI